MTYSHPMRRMRRRPDVRLTNKAIAEIKKVDPAFSPAPNFRIITANKRGNSATNTQKTFDVNIRLENDSIIVDVFRTPIKKAQDAYLLSEDFENSDRGAREATAFLVSEYGFTNVAVRPGPPRLG